MMHCLEMRGCIAVWIFQLTLVLWQKRTGCIEIIFFGFVIERQRVEFATQRFGITEFAALCAKVRASVFNAQMLDDRGLISGERNF